MKGFIVGLTAASALLSSVALAEESYVDDRIYGGLMLNYIDLAAERGAEDSGNLGGKVLIGKQFTSTLGLELSLSHNEIGLAPTGRRTETTAMADVMFYPLERSCPDIVHPFIKAGVGATAWNEDLDSELNLNAGVGAFWRLNDKGMALRTDAGVRILDSDGSVRGLGNKLGEMVVGLGLTMPFGTASTARPSCPSAAEIRAAVPRPTSVDRVMAMNEQNIAEAAAADGMAGAAGPGSAGASASSAQLAGMDRDGDGVVDGVAGSGDRCPNTPAGVRVDVNGCPVPETVVIYFAFDSSALNSAAKGALDRVAANLNNKTFVVAIANGHADSTGTAEYNMGLSDRRASAVANYLISKGVASSAVRKRAYGESRPAADNSTELGRAKNRRVEINLLRQ